MAAYHEGFADLVDAAVSLDQNSGVKSRPPEKLLELTKSAETIAAIELGPLDDERKAYLAVLCVDQIERRLRAFEIVAKSSPLRMSSGQMSFSGTILTLLRAPELEEIRKCLFESWTYSDKGDTLRWSPGEFAKYALMARDPGPLGAWGERGASTLGAVGLLSVALGHGWPQPVCPLAIMSRRAPNRVLVADLDVQRRTRRKLDAISAMTRAGLGAVMNGRFDDVVFVARTDRVKVTDQGDYYSVERAKLLPIGA